MIIIEGPDGAGKSTLADGLAKRLGLDVLKMTVNGGRCVDEYVPKIALKGVIMDRCWISEGIYADVLGREPRYTKDDCEILECLCEVGDVPIVVLLPPLVEVVKRLTARGDDLGDVIINNLETIYHRYEDWVDEHPDAIVLTDNDVSECIDEIVKRFI